MAESLSRVELQLVNTHAGRDACAARLRLRAITKFDSLIGAARHIKVRIRIA